MLRSQWPSGAELREVAVGPLGHDDARALALAMLGPDDGAVPAVADNLARESGGSPFLVEELVRAHLGSLRANGSAPTLLTLEQAIVMRLDALSGPSRRVLELVAVSGRPVSLTTVAAAASLASAEEQVELLRAGRFVRVGLRNGREVVEAAHDRIAQAVVGLMPAARVRALHADLARVLEAASDADAESVALYLLGADEPLRAGPYAERAAEEAIGKLAFDRAAQMFRFALDASPSGSSQAAGLRIRLAQALTWAGRGAQAAELYLAASEAAHGAERLELQRAAAEQLLASGRIDEGGDVLWRLLAELKIRVPRSTLSALFWFLVYRAWLAVVGLRVSDRERKDPPRDVRFRIDTMYVAAVGFALVDVLRGAYVQTRYLLLALRAGDGRHVMRAAAIEAGYRASMGGAQGGVERRFLDAADRLASRIGDAESEAFFKTTLGMCLFLRGKWAQAHAILDKATTRLVQGLAQWQANGQIFATSALYFMGDIRELVRRNALVAADAAERGNLYTMAHLATTTSITAHLVADDAQGARRQLREALGQWSHSGFLLQQWQAMVFEPDIELYSGDGAAAYERFARDLPALRASMLLNIQFVRCVTLYAQGRCAAASIEALPALRASRIAEARRAARRLARERMPWADVLGLTVRAAADHAAGDRTATVEALENLTESAERAGMAMHACAARYRLGMVVGGSEGRTLVQAAERKLASEGIQNHARWLAVLLPGRWGG
jgi:hypothetical protein